jgi:hypothetical protein
LPKIAELRALLNISEKFIPNHPKWVMSEPAEDPLFLKTAFDETHPFIGQNDQMSIGPVPEGKNDIDSKNKSRSQSPDGEPYSLEKSYVKKGLHAHDLPNLERIDEKDESSVVRPDRKAEDSGIQKGGSEAVSLKEINEGKSDANTRAQNNEVKLPFPLEGMKSPEDPSSLMLPSQGKSSPTEGRSGNKSKNGSRAGSRMNSKSPSRSPTRKNSGAKIPNKSELKPPPPPEYIKDDLPTVKQLIRDMLKKEYNTVLQSIEIEDQFENLDMNPDDEFNPNLDDDHDHEDSVNDSTAGVPTYGRDEQDIKERDKYEQELDHQVEKNPESIELHYKLGVMEIKKGEFSDKLKYHFMKVNKLDPHYKKHIVSQALGELYFKIDDEDSARVALYFFREALPHSSTDKFHTLVRIAQCYSKLGKLNNAEIAYKEVSEPDLVRCAVAR